METRSVRIVLPAISLAKCNGGSYGGRLQLQVPRALAFARSLPLRFSLQLADL